MKDMIPNGTGDSRYLKSSLANGTTWADALALLQAGTFPVDFNGLNPGGITQTGSAYSKANVLPDDVCSLLGLNSATAEPKDAFEVVGNPAELWVWEQKNASTTAHIGYVVSTSSITYPEDGQSGDYWYTRLGQIGGCAHIETGSYLSTGAYGAANAMSLTFDFIPKMVMVYVTGGSLSGFAFFNIGSLTESYQQYAYETAGAIGSGNQQYLYAKINNKTLSWYASNNAVLQLNALFTGASLAYHYIAIG